HTRSRSLLWRRHYGPYVRVVEILEARHSTRHDIPALLYVLLRNTLTGIWSVDVLESYSGLRAGGDALGLGSPSPSPSPLALNVEQAFTLSGPKAAPNALRPLILIGKGGVGVSVFPDNARSMLVVQEAVEREGREAA